MPFERRIIHYGAKLCKKYLKSKYAIEIFDKKIKKIKKHTLLYIRTTIFPI